MEAIQSKNMRHPDETRSLPKAKMEIVSYDNITIMRVTFEPGWKWSECVKPTIGTKSCLVPHLNYIISGRLHIAMDDGTSKELGPGDIALIPPGHDAWIVGNEPCVALDIVGGKIYGKK